MEGGRYGRFWRDLSQIGAATLPHQQVSIIPQRLSPVPLADLVPETREWNQGKGIDLKSWIQCVGSLEHAIAYSELFWPDFEEHDGCIFFAGGFSEDSYRGFMQQQGSNRRSVEAVMNHWHILDLFSTSANATKWQILYMGRLLKEIWSAKLQIDFPSRQFVVDLEEATTDDLLEFVITFFQK